MVAKEEQPERKSTNFRDNLQDYRQTEALRSFPQFSTSFLYFLCVDVGKQDYSPHLVSKNLVIQHDFS